MSNLTVPVLEFIQNNFPVVGKNHTLYIENARAEEPEGSLPERMIKAKIRRESLLQPIKGDLILVDNTTKKVLDKKKDAVIAYVPYFTTYNSYIIDGNDYIIPYQLRLRPGVYTRIQANGVLESQFNVKDGPGFSIEFDPEQKQFSVVLGTSHFKAYPFLKVLGVTDEQMMRAWPREIFEAQITTPKKTEQEIVKLYRFLFGREPKLGTDVQAEIKAIFDQSQLDPKVTKITLGEEFNTVSGRAVLKATQKALAVSQGKAAPDPRDSLFFKQMLDASDQIRNRLNALSRRIKSKIANNLDRKDKISDIYSPDILTFPVVSFFKSVDLAELSREINPIDRLSARTKVTLMGEGGISSVHAVPMQAKMLDFSHIGFLDPLHTPEGEKVGTTLHTGVGVKVKNGYPVQTFYTPEGKTVELTPLDTIGKVIALPGQFEWDRARNKPRPIKDKITALVNGDIKTVSPKEVDFILAPRHALDFSAWLIPFLETNSPPRVAYAQSHITQALPLKYREPPLIQVKIDKFAANPPDLTSNEELLGRMVAIDSPVAGTVTSVTEDEIIVKGKDRKVHKFPLLKYFPTNTEGTFIHYEPVVKKGDKVKEGDLLAESIFTKDGTLAYGINLRVAYLPWFEQTYDDAIAISESAAKKLTSLHLYEHTQGITEDRTFDLKKYRSLFPNNLTDEQAKNYDENGIIKVGTTVNPGDILIASFQKRSPSEMQLLEQGIGRFIFRPFKDTSVKWTGQFPGKVVRVENNGKEVIVHVATEEPATVGDKLSGRYGNKGVIAQIIPDEEMPRTADGEPIEIILNPATTAGRILVGPFAETALSHVAEKRGAPIAVGTFEPRRSSRYVHVKGHFRTYHTKEGPVRKWVEAYDYEKDIINEVHEILEQEGLTDRKEVIDPLTGKSYGQVVVGKQYIIKQIHQAEKKFSARGAGPGYAYDGNAAPASGGEESGMSIGELGIHSLLAHGATAFLREAQTFKSDATQDEVWTNLQLGKPLPTPKPSFAYNKFLAYLRALGVNVERKNDYLQIFPLTDEEALKVSNGELANPSRLLVAPSYEPEKGGLFDKQITGGVHGTAWSHFTLAEPMPNPLFEKAIKILTGLSTEQYEGLLSGKAVLNTKTGEIEKEQNQQGKEYLRGGYAIEHLLKQINVEKELEKAEKELEDNKQKLTPTDLDKLVKKVKILRALKSRDMKPDVYIRRIMPVLPPAFRPIALSEKGDIIYDSLNQLYKYVAIDNEQLRDFPSVGSERQKGKIRWQLYDALKAFAGLDGNLAKTQDLSGILDILHGTELKHGFYQRVLLKRRQDLSARGVIVPDANLDINEIGIPVKMAIKIYEPFLIKALREPPFGYSVLQARELIKKQDPIVIKILEQITKERPVAVKRDPALHKHSFMGFYPRLVEGYSIHINPLVTEGFNADHDGDAMSMFVPVTQEAVEEVKRMLPTNILRSPTTGSIMYRPRLDAAIGLYLLTTKGKVLQTKKYTDENEIKKDVESGELNPTDIIFFKNKPTTGGRVLLASTLPDNNPFKEKLLFDLNFELNKKNLDNLLNSLVSDRFQYGQTVSQLNRYGFAYATKLGYSIGVSDLISRIKKERDAIVREAQAKIEKNPSEENVNKVIAEANDKLQKLVENIFDENNALIQAHKAGAKIKWDTLRQLFATPLSVVDVTGPIPRLIKKSYSEGLDFDDYWIASIGGRKSMYEKTQEVSVPGALNKQLASLTMGITITHDDCGSTHKLAVSPKDPKQYVGRFLAAPVKIKGKEIPRNTLITPELAELIQKNIKDNIYIRSPLGHIGKGMCIKDYGVAPDGELPKIGTNVGILASQAVGERGVQLSLRQFHTGGTVTGRAQLIGALDRVMQIFNMPERLPNSATLAKVSGKVEKITKDPAGGWRVFIKSGQEVIDHYVPEQLQLKVKEGDEISKGLPISTGVVNPHELLKLRGINAVRGYLLHELKQLYEPEGVHPVHLETIVKAVTSAARIQDPGDSDFVKNDIVNVDEINEWNKNNPGKRPIIYEPVLKSAQILPLEISEDWLARMAYRGIKPTLEEGSVEMWKSYIHGEHPIPGLVYGAEFGEKKYREKGHY